ncbi:MAG: hypothetical protein ACRCTE_10935 [Cellulosilyticaceae bacterium]
MDREREIQEAVYAVYSILKDVVGTKGGRSMLSPDIVDKLCYSKEEVRKVLGSKQTNTKETSPKISPRIGDIIDSAGVRKLYYEEIIKLFDPKLAESTKNTIKRGLKVDDLVYLYSLISSVGAKRIKNKQELLYMFKEYYDNEVRTADMNRKLKGK